MADVFRDTIAAIRDRVADLEHGVSRGQCSDFPAYCKQVGIIAGLEEALTLFRDVLQKIEGDDDD